MRPTYLWEPFAGPRAERGRPPEMFKVNVGYEALALLHASLIPGG